MKRLIACLFLMVASAAAMAAAPVDPVALSGPAGNPGTNDGVSNTPTFTWGAVPDATSYNLSLLDNTTATSVLSTYSVTGTSWAWDPVGTGITGLLTSHRYAAWMQAVNGEGNGPWSLEWDFVVGPAAPTATPAFTFPADNQSGVLDTPTFTWSPVDGANSFYLCLFDYCTYQWVLSFVPVAGTETQYSVITALPHSHPYGLFLQSLNDFGQSGWASVSFTVGAASAPAAVTMTGPVGSGPNNDGISVHPIFTWTAADGADGYFLSVIDWDIWAVNSGNPWVINYQRINAPTTSFSDMNVALTPYHKYGVWVNPNSDYYGGGNWSAGYDFVVGDALPPPTAPVIATPSGIQTTGTPLFSWNAVDGASLYYLSVYDNDQFAWVISSQIVRDTSYTPAAPLPWYDHYTAYVQPLNEWGPGQWSNGLDFQLMTHPASPPTVTSPVAGSGNPDPLTIQWNTVPQATKYHLVVYDNSLFAGVFDLANLTGTSYDSSQAPKLVASHSYALYMQAGNDYGWSEWSTELDFVIGQPVAPPAVVFSGIPSIDAAIRPTLQWTTVEGADHYNLRVRDFTNGVDVFPTASMDGLTSWTPASDLTPMVQYGASMQTTNPFGGTYTDWYYWVVGLTTVPEAPSLTAPTGNSNPLVPTFSWAAVEGATSYRLVVTDTGLVQGAFDGPVGQTTVWPAATPVSVGPVALIAGHSYSAVLYSVNAIGESLSSPTINFGVDANAGLGVAIHVTIRP